MGEQLDELVDVEVVVGLALAVGRLGHVPGGEADAELETVTRGRVGHLAHEVTAPALPRRRLHRVLRVGRRPQAKPVVVLAREDDAGHAGADESAHPLVHVHVGGVEEGRVLVALAPFAIRHRVHAEVDERVHLHFLPLELTVGGPNVGQVVLVDHRDVISASWPQSAGPAPCRFLTKDSPAVNWSPS